MMRQAKREPPPALSGTVVESDSSINAAIKKLPAAWGGDSADEPRYIETVGRRGYRWKSPVDVNNRESIRFRHRHWMAA
jgi:DNA-binding winged helix-turn-helix (wHTH) protein